MANQATSGVVDLIKPQRDGLGRDVRNLDAGDRDAVRKRRAGANCIFGALKAALNLAFRRARGRHPLCKYISNRCLTAIQNWCVRQRLSEYHAGYRAWSRAVLETLPLSVASNDFVFDNKMLVQPIHRRFPIGEISCPTRYFGDASSINFRRGVIHGLGVRHTSAGA
jgi:hypothetical protein